MVTTLDSTDLEHYRHWKKFFQNKCSVSPSWHYCHLEPDNSVLVVPGQNLPEALECTASVTAQIMNSHGILPSESRPGPDMQSCEYSWSGKPEGLLFCQYSSLQIKRYPKKFSSVPQETINIPSCVITTWPSSTTFVKIKWNAYISVSPARWQVTWEEKIQ